MSHTLEQRLSALEKGNRVRQSNAKLKRDLRERDAVSSRVRAAELLVELDEHEGADKLYVAAFLSSIRHAGDSSVGKWLNRSGITPTRRLRDLTPRQVQALVGELLTSAQRMERNKASNGR